MLQGNWCQQYPSHSTGDLVFGADGYLYVDRRRGRELRLRGLGTATVVPVNPCGDPPDGIGGPNDGPRRRGRRAAQPGHPDARDRQRSDQLRRRGAAARRQHAAAERAREQSAGRQRHRRRRFHRRDRPAQPVPHEQASRHNEIWIGDVGWNYLGGGQPDPGPGRQVEDFGWPCYEGDNAGSLRQPGFLNLDLCRRLYGELGPPIPAGITIVAPYYAYRPRAAGGARASSAASGSRPRSPASLFNPGGNFPPAYDHALFFADASRQLRVDDVRRRGTVCPTRRTSSRWCRRRRGRSSTSRWPPTGACTTSTSTTAASTASSTSRSRRCRRSAPRCSPQA